VTNSNATACNTRVGVFKARRSSRKSLRAYLAEYSGIARFHGNFHSLKRVSVRVKEKERREGSSLAERCQEFITALVRFLTRSLTRSLFRLQARDPFNFTLPSSGLDLIALSYSHTIVTYSCDWTEKTDVAIFRIDEKKKARVESSFVPSTRFVSRDSENERSERSIDYENSLNLAAPTKYILLR